MNPLSETTYLVLLALYDEPLHGYGIIKSIEDLSEGSMLIAPGTLYGVLSNLQKQRLIEMVEKETDKRKKKTYCLTEYGKEILRAEYERFLQMARLTEKKQIGK